MTCTYTPTRMPTSVRVLTTMPTPSYHVSALAPRDTRRSSRLQTTMSSTLMRMRLSKAKPATTSSSFLASSYTLRQMARSPIMRTSILTLSQLLRISLPSTNSSISFTQTSFRIGMMLSPLFPTCLTRFRNMSSCSCPMADKPTGHSIVQSARTNDSMTS